MEADASQPGLTEGAGRRRQAPSPLTILVLAIALQAACAIYFIADVVADISSDGADANSPAHNAVELVAALALALGVLVLFRELRRLLARQARMDQQIEVASGAFHDILESNFDEWGLTPAERDVALLLIKGLSLARIADLRGSAEGTVKAHCNKVYAKAGVTGRAELVSHFIEDLMGDRLLPG